MNDGGRGTADPPIGVAATRLSPGAILWLAAIGMVTLALSVACAWMLRVRLDRVPRNRPSEGATAASPSPARGDALLTTGRLVYQVHCARCHGIEGHGDGADAANLQPPPRDFAAPDWRYGRSAEAIRRVTVEGIPGTSMSGWGSSLAPRERDAVVAYVQSLAGANRDAPWLPTELVSLLEAAGFRPARDRRPAPAIELEPLDGERYSLDRYRGEVVLLVFWGTTCGPCLEELPDLERLASEFRGEGLAVLPICVDEPDRAVVRRVAAGRVQRLPVHTDPNGTARLRYDVQALPTAVLIDRGGTLLGRTQGARPWGSPQTRSLLRACLADTGAETARLSGSQESFRTVSEK